MPDCCRCLKGHRLGRHPRPTNPIKRFSKPPAPKRRRAPFQYRIPGNSPLTLLHEYRHGDDQAGFVTQRQMPVTNARVQRILTGPREEKDNLRTPETIGHHARVSRTHMPLAKPCAHGFDNGFLGGEAHGRDSAPGFCMARFEQGELPPASGCARTKPIGPIARVHLRRNAIGLQDIDPDAENHAQPGPQHAAVSSLPRPRSDAIE